MLKANQGSNQNQDSDDNRSRKEPITSPHTTATPSANELTASDSNAIGMQRFGRARSVPEGDPSPLQIDRKRARYADASAWPSRAFSLLGDSDAPIRLNHPQPSPSLSQGLFSGMDSNAFSLHRPIPLHINHSVRPRLGHPPRIPSPLSVQSANEVHLLSANLRSLSVGAGSTLSASPSTSRANSPPLEVNSARYFKSPPSPVRAILISSLSSSVFSSDQSCWQLFSALPVRELSSTQLLEHLSVNLR